MIEEIKIGTPQFNNTISDKINSPRYSTSVGLINFGRDNLGFNWENIDKRDEIKKL